jgi:hypothetical protein
MNELSEKLEHICETRCGTCRFGDISDIAETK